jgi:TatD DNase family protein
LNLNIFDTHAHLDMPHFDTDREEMIERAQDAGVSLINTIGIDVESSRKAIELAEKHPGVVASIGLHPNESALVSKEDIDRLKQLSKHPRVVAIGELGLDYYRDETPRDAQLKVLRWELALAQEVRLPIIIHCRQAQEFLMPVIGEWCDSYLLPEDKPRGVLHCFGSDAQTAEWYIKRGFYISIGAYIGYPSSSQLRETLSSLPVERLVVETDCPFLPPQKYRGKRNEPAYTVITVGVLADIKNVTVEEMAEQTTRNAIKLFNIREKVVGFREKESAPTLHDFTPS